MDFLGSMWTRFRASSTPILQKRVVDSIIGYAMAASNQTGIRERWTCPSVEEYIAVRREAGGVKVIQGKEPKSKIPVRLNISLKCFFPLLEYTLEINVPDKAWHHPIIQSFHEAANDIVILTNVSRSLLLFEAYFLWKLLADGVRARIIRI